MSSVIQDSNHVAGSTAEKCPNEVLKDLKICVEFDYKADYDGEYGFDNSSGTFHLDTSGYTGDEEDRRPYKKWKMEFTTSTDEPKDTGFDESQFPPASILGLDKEINYDVPWLSAFPNQLLDLTIDIAFLEGSVQAGDIIKLPPIDHSIESNIGFSPNIIEIPALSGASIGTNISKEIQGEMNYVTFDFKLQVSIGTLYKHTLVEALDKNNNPIGYLKVLQNSNHEEFKFNITPVRILRSITKVNNDHGKKVIIKDELSNEDREVINEDVYGGFSVTGKLQGLEDYLNTKSMNQALLQCDVEEVIDLIIDEKEWIREGKIILQNGSLVFNTVKLADNVFEDELFNSHPDLKNKSGVFLFLAPLNHANNKANIRPAAYANLHEITAECCIVFKESLCNHGTYAHEISHVLGLEHSFLDKDDFDNMLERARSIKNESDEVRKIQADDDEIIELRQKIKNLEEKEKDLHLLNEVHIKERKKLIDQNEKNGLSLLDDNYIHYDSSEWAKVVGKLKAVRKKIKSTKKELKELEDKWVDLKDYRSAINRKNYYHGWNPHKFIQTETKNFMDYYNKRKTLYKFQWLALQNDVKRFYNQK